MGIPRPKDLADLRKLKAHLRVICPGCGRSGVYALEEVISYFRARRWNSAWQAAGARFRCEGCGCRGARLGLAVPQPAPPPPVPQPTVVDHKRQLRRARG